MQMQTKKITGAELKVGDVLVGLWHAPNNRDRIVCLEPYRGPLGYLFPKGAQIAGFAVSAGMTIDNSDLYEVIQ